LLDCQSIQLMSPKPITYLFQNLNPQQALYECDNMNLTKLWAEVTEKAMEINPQWGKQERYHVLLIEKYFVLDDLESFETSLERARGLFPESILLKFFTAILLKRTGVNFINILHHLYHMKVLCIAFL